MELPDTKEQLREALAKLLTYGDHVVVEKKIKGREIQIAVLGDAYLPAVEIIPVANISTTFPNIRRAVLRRSAPPPSRRRSGTRSVRWR